MTRTGDRNAIIARNVKDYINAVGKSPRWVSERIGISETAFYDLLNEEGDMDKSIPKLNKLFRIQDPFYFYNENPQLPLTLEEVEANSIQTLSPAIFNGSDNQEFRETMMILEDVMNMIHTLKTAKELG